MHLLDERVLHEDLGHRLRGLVLLLYTQAAQKQRQTLFT